MKCLNLLFGKKKYSRVLSAMPEIKYLITIDRLRELIENHSGWNKFIAGVLELAGVNGVKGGMHEWEYSKDNYRFNLCLDNKS